MSERGLSRSRGVCVADMASSALNLAVLLIGGALIGWRITSDPASAILAVLLLLWLQVPDCCLF